MNAFAMAALCCAAPFVASGAPAPSKVVLSKPLPSLVRLGQHIEIKGHVRRAPAHVRVALQSSSSGPWSTLARALVGPRGGFKIIWHVGGNAGPLSLRVAAFRDGKLIAATPAHQSAVGPRAVYCAPPVPPAVDIPVGSGWIVGGLYLEGGPFPGIFECEQQSYTVDVQTSSGTTIASQTVAGGHSYTIVVPAGSYKLHANVGCFGSATVTAGQQTKANTVCPVP